jgi:hypothetical protein
MSRKQIKWFGPSLKALFLSLIFYLFSKMFLRGVEKQSTWSLKRKKIRKTLNQS